MDGPESSQLAIYKLPLPHEPSMDDQGKGAARNLPTSLLVQNALWFCRFRWLVIAIFIGYGLIGLIPGLVEHFGLRCPGTWPFGIAALLTLGNIAFLLLARTKTSADRIIANLWSQIIVDLTVLTFVVYFVGSLDTNIAFTYLFHIVLACVFFSYRQSLIVTIMAICMFAVCAGAEYGLKILPPMSVFAEPVLEQGTRTTRVALTINFFLAVGIWLFVWYLASHLSSLVRQRDYKLGEANERLIAAQQERSRHMLATTHQLKAPFAAIHSNAQLMLGGYCGDLPDEAIKVTQKILARCRRLTTEIQEMLQLANLGSEAQEHPPQTKMVSTDLLMWCVSQLEPLAKERGVTFETELRSVPMVGSEDHFKMLFGNLLSNAVVYSHKGGRVHLACQPGSDEEPIVTITDTGIGIATEKLSHIFEEHYRTKEAVQHNKESSGLGLSIVKYVAEIYKIHICVKSTLGSGTRFELTFPTLAESLNN